MNLKKLIEQRNEKITAMQEILAAVETENRAMNTEENTKFDELETEIRALSDTIAKIERTRSLEIINSGSEKEKDEKATIAEMEERAFKNHILSQVGGAVENRAGEQNLTMGNNGAVIPKTIAQRIVKTIVEISPVYEKATKYNSRGALEIPVYGLSNTTHDITVGYQTEFTAITADVGKFTSVELGGFLAGALSLLGITVINNADIDVVSFIITDMASKISIWLEKESLTGAGTTAMTGANATTNTMKAGSISEISADNLIDLQAKIKTAYQKNAIWIMAPATFTVIRKLKDGNGQYLLQSNFSQDFPYAILGKPVHLSDNMPAIGSAAKAVLYGDFSGYSINMREAINIQILKERYADLHAYGVIAWFEVDGKITDNQKIASLVMSV